MNYLDRRGRRLLAWDVRNADHFRYGRAIVEGSAWRVGPSALIDVPRPYALPRSGAPWSCKDPTS